jgi:hypothetical protein
MLIAKSETVKRVNRLIIEVVCIEERSGDLKSPN